MLFHYTSLDAIPAIERTGYLRRSKRTDRYGGVVWLSSNGVFEPVAGKLAACGSRFMTFEELIKHGEASFARFRLMTPLPEITKFARHVYASGDPVVEALRREVEEKKARAGTNPGDWYYCAHEIELKHLSLEVWSSEFASWQPISPHFGQRDAAA